MAEHDGAADETETVEAGVEEIDAEDIDAGSPDEAPKRSVREWFSGTRGVVVVSVAVIVALLGAGGWLGYLAYADQQTQARRSLYLQVARQTAINLTTIDHAHVENDINRVLDGVTGAFHEEYQTRSKPFVEVVKKVQSKTEGTIAEAGLVSYAPDQAEALIAISVKTSLAGAPQDQEPHRWRMRLTVEKAGDSAKVSKVEFVP
ncbi:Mce protein [Candidatus Mycobacterium wuenschmannii]|uniref:Mce protein n=1 Tax=Candidatus Mycobacterium wuenschmannii TaxID=3027808 RepID=A0ABY8W0C6_9MYCO|nr:Mce protein [Candidatus Mycobacterium wuenschmannii]WIM89343.1 Mce protein [Candidatus Mycobacterium wuenschmannii]